MCCIPLGLGEVPELTNYPYEVLDGPTGLGGPESQFWRLPRHVRSRAAVRCIISNPSAFKAALRAHRFLG